MYTALGVAAVAAFYVLLIVASAVFVAAENSRFERKRRGGF